MAENNKDCPLSVSDWVNYLKNSKSRITSKMISILQILIAMLAIFSTIIYLAGLRDNIVKNLFAGTITISMVYFTAFMVVLALIVIIGILILVFVVDYIKEIQPIDELLDKIIGGEDNSNVIRKEWKENIKKTRGKFIMSSWMKWLIAVIIGIVVITVFIIISREAGENNFEEGKNLFLYVALPIIIAYSTPFFYNWFVYRFSKPNFTAHLKPADGKTFIERKAQEIELEPNKEQLIWVMLHNNGKVIKDNWFVNIDFEKGFQPIKIENTSFKDVDFVKRYTIQQKYNVAHFNSVDFSPLIPHDETIIFPVIIKTPKEKKIYKVSITVKTGDYSKRFSHNMKIKIL